MDQQVKIRGFRVEPGEIEAALARVPEVAQACVIAREDQTGDKQLVGYVVPEPGSNVDPAILRRTLATTLPEHMIPGAIVVLESLPLTPNGKLDSACVARARVCFNGRACAAHSARGSSGGIVRPDVLGIGKVSIDDSFFDLGGHSLLATRLIGRIRRTLGVELPIRVLFEAPSGSPAGGTDEGCGARRRRASADDEAKTGAAAAVTCPAAVVVSVSLRRAERDLQRSDGAAADRCIGRRSAGGRAMRFSRPSRKPADNLSRSGWGFPASRCSKWTMSERGSSWIIRMADDGGVSAVLAAKAAQAIHLEREIPLRASLLRLAAEDHILLVLLHHIGADGWSFAPLTADLTRAYAARTRGETPDAAPVRVQYADYTLWQRELLGGDENPESLASRQSAYWREKLAGLPDCITLPTDRPRPTAASYRGALVQFAIPADLHQQLRSLAGRLGASLFMVLNAGAG